ncbi:hypothetical protein amyaer_p04740 (plasmid) [Microcystis aeruginosa NIES-2481]|nr:hypothetical protein amyaer_p04740 [Microcystis aeruginosa NIES-2481]
MLVSGSPPPQERGEDDGAAGRGGWGGRGCQGGGGCGGSLVLLYALYTAFVKFFQIALSSPRGTVGAIFAKYLNAYPCLS